jgi:hypothetical protein
MSDQPHRRIPPDDSGPPDLPTMTEVVRDLADHGWSADRIAHTLSITIERVHHLLVGTPPTARRGMTEENW